MDATVTAKPLWTLSFDRKKTAVAVAVLLNLLFASTLLISSNWHDASLLTTLAVAWGAMSIALVYLFATAKRSARAFEFECFAQQSHYLHSMMLTLIILYWGLWWQDVFSHLVLVLVQILFAYNFELLLFWFRRQKWRFGFGVLPIVFSMNFFLWFNNKWFCLQLLTIVVALLSKTYLTRKHGERRTHIFNPSAFSLTLVTVLLLATGGFHVSQGINVILSFFLPPHMMEFLFLLILVSNIKFNTTLITASACITMLALNSLLISTTGYPLLERPFDPQIFLGAGLLLTDPATSPRSKTGKALFGVAYGILVYIALALLYSAGKPGYFDKILPVLMLNLIAPSFDTTGARLASVLRARLGSAAAIARSKFVHVAVWTACFLWATPVLMENRQPILIPTPIISANMPFYEVSMLLQRSVVRCNKYPDLCRPFGFAAELRYWLGPERQEELLADKVARTQVQ